MLDKILLCFRGDVALCHISVIAQHLDEIVQLCDGKYLTHDDAADTILDSCCQILQQQKLMLREKESGEFDDDDEPPKRINGHSHS